MIIWRGMGNLLEDEAMQVCPINAMGAMGAGLALAMRRAYVGLFPLYRDLYHPSFSPIPELDPRARQLVPVTVTRKRDGAPVSVLLFPTKLRWQDPSPYYLVEANLAKLSRDWKSLGISALAMPLVGTGHGGLPRRRVEALIDRWLGDSCELPIRLYLSP